MRRNKRVLLCRHGNECKQHKIEHIQTRIGLSDQGALRAFFMPEIIASLIGDEPYEVHTYTNPENGVPTSRSYYTAQLLDNIILYDQSEDIKLLVENIKKSKAKNIIVIWSHYFIELIIEQLIGLKPDWEKWAKKIYKQLDKKYTLLAEEKIELCDVKFIKYSASAYLRENRKAREYYDKPKNDISYAIMFDVDYNNKTYDIFPTYLIEKCKKYCNRYKVSKYLSRRIA